jgi:hypothetical protein
MVLLTLAVAASDVGRVTETTCFCTKFEDTMKKISSKKTTSIKGVISMPASRLAALNRAI